MNNFDFLIIYLAGGAPFGVFYFLTHQKKQIGFQIWLKTFFTFVFWMPFAFRLLKNSIERNVFTEQPDFAEVDADIPKLARFQKQFEEVLRKSELPVSVFEFREVFERYANLTLVSAIDTAETTETETGIFRIVNNGSVEIGAICLRRRNLKRLVVHQIEARRDFFNIVSRLVAVVYDRQSFVNTVTDFFRLLKDAEAQQMLEKISLDGSLNAKQFPDNFSEYYLWNTKKPESQTAKQTAAQLQN